LVESRNNFKQFRNTVSSDFIVFSNKKVTKEVPPTSRPAGALRFSERMGVQGTRSQPQVAQTNFSLLAQAQSNPLFPVTLIASDGG